MIDEHSIADTGSVWASSNEIDALKALSPAGWKADENDASNRLKITLNKVSTIVKVTADVRNGEKVRVVITNDRDEVVVEIIKQVRTTVNSQRLHTELSSSLPSRLLTSIIFLFVFNYNNQRLPLN